MTYLQLFADQLLPILLAAGAGYLLALALKSDGRALASVAFNLFAPCLVFGVILQSHLPAGAMLRMAAFTAASMVLPAALALGVARWRNWPRPLTSAFVLCALLPNSGNYGLSANLLAFGSDGLTYASVFYVASVVVTYSLGVVIASLGRAGLGEALAGLARIPSLWAVAAAFALRATHAAPPAPIGRAVELLAQACIPCFLVILGMQLRGVRLGGSMPRLLSAAALRLVGGTVAGFALARAFGLEGAARQAGVLQSAMPTAVISTILAAQYDVESSFVGSVVLLTTLLSPFTLTPLLARLR
jgi:hypothetical protein